MRLLRMRAWFLAILTGVAATMISIPASQAAKVCPQFVTNYCVVDKDGSRHTAATNPCMARRAGERILHIGECGGLLCTLIVDPVCSIDPTTHKRKTYSSICWSDLANATLVHKGACRGQP